MPCIISTDFMLLKQQQSVFDNIYGYPKNSTLEYALIIKHYNEDKWAIPFYSDDQQYVIPSLQSSISPNISPDWFPPLT